MSSACSDSEVPQRVDTQTIASHHVDKQDAEYGPLAHVNTTGTYLPAFAGELQPGLYKSVRERKIANPAPLGLAGFALTTFVLGCINMQTRGITQPNMVVPLAFAYGGLVQLLAGMWWVYVYSSSWAGLQLILHPREMAAGNTFGATALSSYGGFWISLAMTLTPGGFNIEGQLQAADNGSMGMFYDSFGLYLMGWFIFTFLLVTCTVKSTVIFFSLFATVDIALLLLAVGYLHRPDDTPYTPLLKAGGLFALLGAFLAWYSCLAGIADTSNSFFIIPVWHFPWSEKKRESRRRMSEDP
ncbi:acetate uptake transporter family protein [Aspergillus saccharolyticus JOP 1030-1]|uniref:GPR/FUN34 family protein n=1 Tax=Aspergillus saccharolyticus JOP 1030-1 TaxID=1450539 RepID=A0A318Z716_9EURO|nr:hypothetical protein BP01DRAFT_367882 [Aspergillus saccharolyticus JOP 1030-1]PYH42926.1 hypothetical protein BP01DRAFT_367882 [Aspergillus saccharolyticus JOP 1030-1]